MSDLDDEELKATRILNGTDKRKTADEIFEELGYIKKEEKNYVRYNNFGNTYFGEIIDFDLKNKKFRLTNKTCHGNTHFRYGNMQELQAIKKKCEELGWI